MAEDPDRKSTGQRLHPYGFPLTIINVSIVPLIINLTINNLRKEAAQVAAVLFIPINPLITS